MQVWDADNTMKDFRYRILIVDDEPDDAYVYKLALEGNSQLSVDTFTDPLVALHSLSPGVYDLLLLNARMPKMDGFELCEKIREKDKKVKICFITAQVNCQAALNTYYRDLNVSQVIQKPIKTQELAKIVISELESKNKKNGDLVEAYKTPKEENNYDRVEFTTIEYNQGRPYNKNNKSHFNHYYRIIGEPRKNKQISFPDIGGNKEQLKRIRDIVEFYLTIQSEAFKTERREAEAGLADIGTSKGLLLYGPSGCGKSLLGKGISDIAHKLNVDFYKVTGLEIIISEKNFGGAEQKLRDLF
ncbi:MAG TPA: response regulator, partial [Nitrososphaeraceae archaeon]|nr:response regulator [Nitrososphaeraceae archaeon]